MKKMMMSLTTMSLLAAPPVLAQEADEKQVGIDRLAAEARVEFLITENLRGYESLIHSEASALPAESRYRIYLGTRLADTYPASFLNAIPGLGVGSFSMGDTAGGWTLLGGELAGAAIAVLGTVIGGGSAASASLATGLGTFVVAGFRLYGIFRPIQYAQDYNFRLRNVLSVGPEQSSLAPGLRMSWEF